MPWTPPPRSPWTEKLVALGTGLGDNGRSVVSLQPDELRRAAEVCTGLSDFGDSWWEEPFRRLCASLDDEAQLHLPGRLRTRGELQLILQNRLRLVDLWKREPTVNDERVHAPIVVTGLGRSGTTLLHELLACDPDNRPPLLWELLHSVPAHIGEPPVPYARWAEATARLCDDEITLMDEMVPAFTAMHENGGALPTECIFAFAHQFSSDIYTGLYNVAEYTIWRSSQDQAPIYDWHRRMLQTLQWMVPTTRWVVKAPSHLGSLPLVFATYPDARVVITHRDPLRVIGSLADLMATLHYMHSNHVDHGVLVEFMAMGLEMQMDSVSAERDRGSLPGEQISDVIYRDLVGDPVGTVEGLYARWDLPVTELFRRNLDAYIGARHTDRGPRHDYSFGDTGLDLAVHRALVAPYQARYGVPSEV
ncbi:MAG TPA: sulfotransferase [Acidimicrobiales bacterium]